MKRTYTIYVRETRDYTYEQTVEGDEEELRELLENSLQYADFGTLVYDEPHPESCLVESVSWRADDGATESIIYNPPMEVL